MKVELLGTRNPGTPGSDREPEVLQLRFKMPSIDADKVEVTVGYSDVVLDLEELLRTLNFVWTETHPNRPFP